MATPGILSTSTGASGRLGSHLSHLTMESELQKLLTDEKTRAEKHKLNYQQLKVEHTRLQDKVLELEAENKSTIEESRIVKDKYMSMYEACKQDLAEKIAECEELKTKVITPQRLELMKVQIIDEVERTYRERTNKQEGEVEEYRSVMSKLRIELSFLKSEYEHDKAEFQQQSENLIKQHDIELQNLRQDRDSTITNIRAESNQDSQKVRVLQRENAQLHLQVKELLVELEEIRALREKSGLDADNITRMQSKQISEHQASIRTLEAERESLKRQLENLQRDLNMQTTEQNKYKGEMHELQQKNAVLKCHAEEVIHRSKVDLADLKMEMLKQRGEIEKEKDKLRNEVDDLRSQLDIAESKVGQLQRMLEEKEREIIHRIQGAREEEFSKMAKVENEKFELETKLQEGERRRIDDEARRHAEQEKNNERISQANAAKDQAERELISIKARLGHMDSLQDQLDRERAENSSLKSRIHQLETELNSFNSAEHELTDSNLRLKNTAELLREELKLTQSQLGKLQNNHEVIMLQQRSAMAEDRTQLEQRLSELESRLGDSQSKYSRASVIHKKLKKKSAKMADHLKEKVMILEAEKTELDYEKKALQNPKLTAEAQRLVGQKSGDTILSLQDYRCTLSERKCIPADQYNRLRKHWKDLWRRHQEFRTILLSVPSTCCHDKSGEFFPYVRPAKPSFESSELLIPSSHDNELEKQHQEDLRLLRIRLEALDKVQHQQLVELTDISGDRKQFSPREKVDEEKEIQSSNKVIDDDLLSEEFAS